MHQMETMMDFMWTPMILLFALIFAIAIFFLRKANPKSLLITDIAPKYPNLMKRYEGISSRNVGEPNLHDTVFILPDISHYTRFMTGSHFSFSHAQEIVFSLINSMIEAASKTIHLSKLEGDAALFYIDANKLSAKQIGETVFDIFGAFYSERKRLMESNICRCKACKHISDLDLKIFVHRGRASRFEFRGSVDHFGVDVIILHRLMKNSVSGSRYVMVTEESADCITIPGDLVPTEIEEAAEGIGAVRASIYEIPNEMVSELENTFLDNEPNTLKETARKLGFNVKTLFNTLTGRQYG